MTVVPAAAPARGWQTPELADLSFETCRSEVLSEAFGESFIDAVRGIAPAIVGRPEGREAAMSPVRRPWLSAIRTCASKLATSWSVSWSMS